VGNGNFNSMTLN